MVNIVYRFNNTMRIRNEISNNAKWLDKLHYERLCVKGVKSLKGTAWMIPSSDG